MITGSVASLKGRGMGGREMEQEAKPSVFLLLYESSVSPRVFILQHIL